VTVADVRKIGAEGKHLKLLLCQSIMNQEPRRRQACLPARQGFGGQAGTKNFQAVAFNQSDAYPFLKPDVPVDIAYTIGMNEWNGKRGLQLVVKDLNYSSGNHSASSR